MANRARHNSIIIGQGAQGPQGYQGNIGVGQQGSQGPQGSASIIPGPQGDQGTPGVGERGPQGYQGAVSIVPGPQGHQGNIGVGQQGPQGYQGLASTVPGPQGYQGLASTVPGPQGDQGTPGVGEQGPQGDIGYLQDFTVTWTKLAASLVSKQTVLTSDIDWSLGSHFTMTISSALTLTFSNLQEGKTISFTLTGDFALILPDYVNIVSGEYDGSVSNFIQFFCEKADSGSEIIWCTINKKL